MREKYRSFLRFCIVGCCAAAVHYGVYYLLLMADMPVNAAYIAGYLISFIGNFFATSYFTFSSRPSWGRFIGFSGSHALNFVLHIVLLNLFLWLGIHRLVAPVLVMAVAMVVQYTVLYLVYHFPARAIEGKVLLSFDTEEYDVPKEHGVPWDPIEQGMEISRFGTTRILDCLKECDVRATFFCTANFAKNAPDLIARIIREGHEIASHGCDHWQPKPEHVIESKHVLEDLTGKPVYGYRQPRMFPVDIQELKRQGYEYNASLNPAFIPGRYMHLDMPRTWFYQDGLLQIPASVSPWCRIPLFWLALHNFPLWFYKFLVRRTLRHDGYFNTYFHPWEFYPLGERPEWKMPFIIRHHAGNPMYERLKEVIMDLKSRGAEFVTYHELAQTTI